TLVQEHHHIRHAHLARQEHVLFGLRHRPVGRCHHQDGAVHLRRAGDHVLDVIGVARTIHVRVVPVRGLILHVRGGNGDATLALFRSVVDGVERTELDLGVVLAQYLGDGRRQRGLAMIDVPDRAHVHVRLAAVKFFFRHWSSVSLLKLLICHFLRRSYPSNYFVPAGLLPCTFATISSATERGASS